VEYFTHNRFKEFYKKIITCKVKKGWDNPDRNGDFYYALGNNKPAKSGNLAGLMLSAL
jgi:hypothetical protein